MTLVLLKNYCVIELRSCEFNSKIYVKKVLGLEWDISKDEFIFTFSDIIETTE